MRTLEAVLLGAITILAYRGLAQLFDKTPANGGKGSSTPIFEFPKLDFLQLPSLPNIVLPNIHIPSFGIDMPDIPDIPDLPDLPKLPNLPDLPELPNLPDLPDLPELPNIYEVPALPKLPDLPELVLEPRTPTIYECVWGGGGEGCYENTNNGVATSHVSTPDTAWTSVVDDISNTLNNNTTYIAQPYDMAGA